MYYQQYNVYPSPSGGWPPAYTDYVTSCMHEEQPVWQEPQPPTPPQMYQPPLVWPSQQPSEHSTVPYDWMKKPSYQTQTNPGKTRTKDKYRVVYTDHQRLELEKEFHYSRYITIRRKAELALSLGLSERQVKIWFQNRRAKERKQVKKREELTHKEKIHQLSMI